MKNKYEDIIAELPERELVKHLYITQVLLAILAIGIGWLLFEDFASFLKLFVWNDSAIWLIGIPAGVLVVLVDLTFMKFLPSSYYDDGGLNEKLFSGRKKGEIILIAATVAITEEILFRGVLQTHFGLVVTSVVFALIHYRYLFNWFLFINIIFLSFLIGVIYEWTGNLLVTIMMHFLIDVLLGIAIKRKKDRDDIDE